MRSIPYTARARGQVRAIARYSVKEFGADAADRSRCPTSWPRRKPGPAPAHPQQDLTLEGMRIVIDAAHCAAYRVAPAILNELCADVIAIGVRPDGENINLCVCRRSRSPSIPSTQGPPRRA